ncbi:hypothetical protein RhiirA5_409806 [Rhizophagus irregularis]|uniref:Uncharacterized protein n=1 Tax=Rhizophagus irregularis TaxID=588596 RepID=A0A2N0RUB4_9GLOM|nr:hypothetical protein RhiirA5_409806 [Rhizophagus irregularis]PKC66903.1 hypothetical protein RhiirA1_459089 [Rhizophagus irregularis]
MGQVLVERFESFVVHPGTHIDNSSGYRYAIRKCLLQIGELIIEAIFDNIEYNESDISKSHCPEHIPKDLIDAWKEQLFKVQRFDNCSFQINNPNELFYNILRIFVACQ